MCERNIDQLLPHEPTHNLDMSPEQNRTYNLLVYGTTLQPAEPLGQAYT